MYVSIQFVYIAVCLYRYKLYIYNQQAQNMIQTHELADSQSQDFTQANKRKQKISEYDQNQSDIHNDNSFDAQQSQGISSNQSDEEQQATNITKQEQLERQILKKATQNELTRKPFQRQIMGDILDKLKNIEDVAREKTGEELVGLRIQQLVYSKLLVLTHGCSQFRLVLSHFHLGYAYLRHDCIEQAIEHISIAIHKNQRLFEQLNKCKIFNCIMQNILAECLIKKEEYDDAIQVLDQAILLAERDRLQTEDISNRARVLLAQCYSKHKEYDQAIRIIDEVLAKTKGKPDTEENYAFTLVEKATILASKADYHSGITAQDQAINILIKINYPKPQDVAQMYGKLADYFQKTGNPQSSLACIQKLKTLYQQLYSAKDKRVIKARRRIATSLLKNDRFKQAVDELLQIIKLQAEAFGESSLQIARTLKLLGTVCIRLGEGDARTHLKRAMNIFNAHGNKKQVEEIKQKLKILMQSSGNNNDMKILSEQDL